MQITFERRGGAAVIQLQGELDHHTAAYAREHMDQYIMTNPCKKTVLDLTGLSFMDSSGIGVIIGRYQNIRALSGKVAVVCQKPQIRKILEMAGIPKLIPVCSDLDQALFMGEDETDAC